MAIAPILKQPNTILVRISNGHALTYFPAEKSVEIRKLPNGKLLKNPVFIRGQPNVRPRALMAVLHNCQPSTKLRFDHHSWFVPMEQ